MRNYFRMKKNEWKVKAMFYGLIVELAENQKDIIALVQNLYLGLKDTPVEELRSELTKHIAEFAHDQAVKEREALPKQSLKN